MATMTFLKSSGVLNWPDFGGWTAVSGGWGDPLPTGMYTVERCNVTGYTELNRERFQG